jgi:hypothetical protein
MALRITGVSQTAQSGLAQAQAKEQADIDTLDRVIAADVNALASEITQARIAAENQAFRWVQEAEAQATGQVDGVRTQLGQVQTNLQANINTETNQRLAQISQVQTNLQGNINHVFDTVETDLAQATNTLHGQITNGVTTAENFATGLVSGLGIGTIANTLTSLQARLSKVETETADCLEPLCDTVTPQAQRLGRNAKNWQNLEDLGIAALLIALAAECMTDPGAVAHDVSSVVSGAGDVVLSGYRDLIGA